MKKLLIISVFIFFANSFFCQNYLDTFSKLCQEQDTTAQKELLEKWKKEDPDSPELLTSYYNYYYRLSTIEVLTIESNPKDQLSLQIINNDDSIEGYISSKNIFEFTNFQKAISIIDDGILKHPKRLDMRFGKTYALGQDENWQAFTDEIKTTIKYSFEINHEWLWTYDKKLDEGEEIFYNSIQNYSNQIYDTQDDDLLPFMREIAECLISFNPKHVESLSNLSITYMLEDNYKKALEPLLKAEKIAPKDYIVLNNIAHAYKQLSEYKKAIKYYEKAYEHGDEYTKHFALEQISTIKENK